MLPEGIKEALRNFLQLIRSMGILDVLDILCVALVLYFAYQFIRDRRAGRLAIGVLLLVGVLALSELLGMSAMKYLLQNVFQVGLVAIVVVFQPELRSALEKMGEKFGIGSIASLTGITDSRKDTSAVLALIDAVADASADMSREKTGALIVIERAAKLGDIFHSGTVIDSAPSSFLIKNIFFKNSPLHDGALIVRDNRLYAAGCVLPLSQNPDIIKDLGTRHRAAIGMSENSDAVVVVVSEETGMISVAYEGKLTRGFTRETLMNTLKEYLCSQPAGAVAAARNRILFTIGNPSDHDKKDKKDKKSKRDKKDKTVKSAGDGKEAADERE